MPVPGGAALSRRADRPRPRDRAVAGRGGAHRRRPQPQHPVMRLFIALFPPPEALSHLESALSTLDVKLSDPGRWHLTLAFLGEVPEADPAVAALAEAELNPVGALEIRGGGRFGAVL